MQRCQLFPLYQVKLLDEVDEMFETGVEVSLLAERHDLLDVEIEIFIES